MLPTGLRSAGPYPVSVPGPAIATGQPRVHVRCDQLVSKYSRGWADFGPKYLVKLRRTAARRSALDIGANFRASSPPMNPKTTPFDALRGESSKVVLAGPSYETTLPFSPASRQKGSSYTAVALISVPCGRRWVSWSRSNGSPGW